MQVIVNVEDLTDEMVDQLWSMHRFLKKNTPREALAQGIPEEGSSSSPTREWTRGEEDRNPPVATIDDVRAALEKVAKQIGMGRPIQIVQRHGADRVSKLDPSKYSDVVRDCEEALEEA